MFNSLTGSARSPKYNKAVVAPERMRAALLEEIDATVQAHKAGEEARIVMKMNALVDRRCIRALYQASQAGVRVDLNVRGICCLRPGVEGVSENIGVVSVVGRFLEHARIYGFHRGSERRYFIGSADLMPRNLDTRVELLAPVEDPVVKGELEDTLDRCLADDTFAWELGSDGEWTRRTGGTRSVHAELMERALERAGTDTE
jgi:polyphosphate kinase